MLENDDHENAMCGGFQAPQQETTMDSEEQRREQEHVGWLVAWLVPWLVLWMVLGGALREAWGGGDLYG